MRVPAGSDAELPGPDWSDGGEEFHDVRALDDLVEGFLDCDGSHSWLASLQNRFVERDGQELCPVQDAIGPHLAGTTM